jgi:hypothetical protein
MASSNVIGALAQPAMSVTASNKSRGDGFIWRILDITVGRIAGIGIPTSAYLQCTQGPIGDPPEAG